ncbi:MAG: hypothetical protein HY873_00775 [Chloroflexi bacterium]|nr:hypothetical protein [Chloroflexota bacterium]
MSQTELAHRFILDTFTQTGCSPSLLDIQRRFELAAEEDALALLEELEGRGLIHRTAGDRRVTHAYPFSNLPTSHRVRISGGPEVFAMCAIDALGIPFMLKRDAAISSACEQCGSRISVEIAKQTVIASSPAGMVVWVGKVSAGCVPANDLCPDLNFFCAAGDLDAWRMAREEPDGTILTLEQAVVSARRIFEDLLNTSEFHLPTPGGGA